MPEISDETREALWSAARERADELMKSTRDHPNRGSSRSQAYYSADGFGCLCYADVTQLDGSHVVYIVTARYHPHSRQPVDVTVETSFHNNEPFWERQIADRSNAAVVDGYHYRIGDEKARGSRGFGGRRLVLEDLATGERTVTTNLWYQGVIPPALRDRLPDTHRFAEAGE